MMNIKGLINMYSQLLSNPSQLLQQMNIPNEYANNPQGAIQYLMNNGRISQEQYNKANNQLKQLQSDPMFRQFFNK